MRVAHPTKTFLRRCASSIVDEKELVRSCQPTVSMLLKATIPTLTCQRSFIMYLDVSNRCSNEQIMFCDIRLFALGLLMMGLSMLSVLTLVSKMYRSVAICRVRFCCVL
eukprot:6186065-Pleurochrysis_carterae.AAC.2